ncbi:MAG: CvpA family protein [Treponema sp.]
MKFSLLDSIFIGLSISICARAAFRGFIREFFSTAAFLIAALAGILFYPVVSRSINIPDHSIISGIISFILIFSGIFIVIKGVQVFLSNIFNNEILKGLDRSLGFFLGVGESLGIILIAIFILQNQHYLEVSRLLNQSIIVEVLQPMTAAFPQFLQLMQKTAVQAIHDV